MEPTKALPVTVKHLSWNTFEISFKLPSHMTAYYYIININSKSPELLTTSGVARFPFTVKFQSAVPGVEYIIAVSNSSLEDNCHNKFFGARKFRTEYTQTELKQLLKRAENFKPLKYQPCEYFYRDEPESYFNNREKVLNNVMKVYDKDQNGDPLSPINGQIKGLFFGVNVDFRTSKPCTPSIYGNWRLKVPWDYFWDERPNLYFSDFYCINKPHLVTLVMTIPGSERDKFCKEKLVALDWNSNPFLFYEDEELRVISNGLWVEVLYTEDVDIEDIHSNGGSLGSVAFLNVKRHGGRAKKTHCLICNI